MTSLPLRSRRRPWLAWLAVVALAATAWPGSALGARGDVRALWVVRTTLVSPEAVAAMVRDAAAAGFNTLIVQPVLHELRKDLAIEFVDAQRIICHWGNVLAYRSVWPGRRVQIASTPGIRVCVSHR
jgi:hypothetical protein